MYILHYTVSGSALEGDPIGNSIKTRCARSLLLFGFRSFLFTFSFLFFILYSCCVRLDKKQSVVIRKAAKEREKRKSPSISFLFSCGFVTLHRTHNLFLLLKSYITSCNNDGRCPVLYTMRDTSKERPLLGKTVGRIDFPFVSLSFLTLVEQFLERTK